MTEEIKKWINYNKTNNIKQQTIQAYKPDLGPINSGLERKLNDQQPRNVSDLTPEDEVRLDPIKKILE